METSCAIDLRETQAPLFRRSVFFRDKNEDKFVEEYIETDSCAGDGDCIRLIKDSPFEWKNTLLNSTKFEESMNFEKYYKADIKEVSVCSNGLWLKIDMPLEQGDIIVSEEDPTLEYFISYTDGWVNKDRTYTIKIDKVDNTTVDSLDYLLLIFAEHKTINVIGELK